MPRDGYSIAQVTPYAWEQDHEVNVFVERVSDELCARGHRVVVIAPSESRDLVRSSREVMRRVGADPDALFADSGCANVVAVGQGLGRAGGRAPVPVDASRRLGDLLSAAAIDFLHVHEPFAPSLSSAALRHSRSLNVGTFHSATERVLSTQVARRFVRLLFGRLDGRTASWSATRDLVCRYFPGDYLLVPPGSDVAPGGARGPRASIEIFYAAREERGALRLFLRALRRLPEEADWNATVWLPTGAAPPVLSRALRSRVRVVGPQDGPEPSFAAAADVVVAASTGTRPRAAILTGALSAGAVPVASRLSQYEETLREGELGLLFDLRDGDMLAAQLERVVVDPGLRGRLASAAEKARPDFAWSRAADQIEDLYRSIAARRHDPAGKPAVRKRLEARPFVHVDLHMHTDHSPDCATPVDVLLETAAERGLGAIAVTDHNEISGALLARERAPEVAPGLQVIVAEEIKTADQGEVIGLFLEELIPRGMTLAETIAAIRVQGGLVYVPHPFDRMHAVPDYEHLLDAVEDIDAIEVFNPRVAISSFNEEAVRFAGKYRIVAGAGSDSHVAAGLGSVKIRMRAFDGPEEFLESLRAADIVRHRPGLLYVQALKFIQTKATPEPMRRKTARPARKSRAGTRPSNK